MKNYLFYLLPIYFLFQGSSCSIGQNEQLRGTELIMAFDEVFRDFEGKFNEGIQSHNGDLIFVGVQEIDGQKKGVLVMINPMSQAKFQTTTFSRTGWINTIVQTEKGHFILGGGVIEKGIQKGWIIKTDEFGDLMSDFTYPGGKDIEFNKLLILNNSTLIAAGSFGKSGSGKLNLCKININDLDQYKLISTGNGELGKLVGIKKINRKAFTIFGETQKMKAKDINDHDIWKQEYEVTQKFIFLNTTINSTESEEKLFNYSSNIKDEDYLFGLFREKRRPQQILVSNYNSLPKKTGLSTSSAYKKAVEVRGLKSFQGDYFLVSQILIAGTTFDKIRYKANIRGSNGIVRARKIIDVHPTSQKSSEFELSHIFELQNETFCLVGSEMDDGISYPRVILLKDTSFLRSRSQEGKPDLEFVGEPKFVDANGKEIKTIQGREHIYLHCRLQNNESQNLYKNFIEVSLVNEETKGIKFYKSRFISVIKAYETKDIYIPVLKEDPSLKGNIAFKVFVRNGGNEITKEIINLFVGKPNSTSDPVGTDKSGIVLSILQPINRNSETTEATETIIVQALSNQPLNKQDFVIYMNGDILPHSKDPGTLTIEENTSNKEYNYRFTFEAPLEQGQNEIFVGLPEKGADIYTPVMTITSGNKPNLHVLSIGPKFKKYDLKYNTTDAMDFANLMDFQDGPNALYKKANIHEFTIDSNTTKTKIASYFEKLSGKFGAGYNKSDKIYKDDVLVIFISSHGKLVNRSLKIIPSDYDPDAPLSTSIDYQRDILDHLNKIHCKKILFLDACHSGAAKDGLNMGRDAYLAEQINELFRATPGLTTFTSSQANQLSYEDSIWQNGAFTEAIIEAFEGVADVNPADGFLNLQEIIDYVKVRVPKMVQEKIFDENNLGQEPDIPRFELKLKNNYFITTKYKSDETNNARP